MTAEEKKARRARRRQARKAAEAAKTQTKVAVIHEIPDEEPQQKKRKKRAKPQELPKKNTVKKSDKKDGPLIPDPKNLSALKKYVTVYFRAIGWKNRTKEYRFPDTCIHIRNFSLEKIKEDQAIEISFDAAITAKNALMTKTLTKRYTLDNFREVKSDIVNVIRQVRSTSLVSGDKADVAGLKKAGWSKIHS